MSTTVDGTEGGLGAVPDSPRGSAGRSRLLAVHREAENRGSAAGAGKAEGEARAILERREDYQEMIQDCIREMRRESNLEMRRESNLEMRREMRLEMRKKRMQDDAKKRTRERIDYNTRVYIPQTLARAYGLQMIAESC